MKRGDAREPHVRLRGALSLGAFLAGTLGIGLACGGQPPMKGTEARHEGPAGAPTGDLPGVLTGVLTGVVKGVHRGRVIGPGGRAFEVEVVQDELARQRGLQQRAHLDENAGMLFVFPTSANHRFWMHKCLIPLDIIWLDSDRRVVHVEERLPICKALPCPDYGPDRPSLYVLELGAGVAARAGIRPGTRLEILFAEPPRPS